MQFNDKEKKILERITSFNKPVRSRIKRVYSSPKQKVKTENISTNKKDDDAFHLKQQEP